MWVEPEAAVTAVAAIPAVSTILDVVCRATGMGFAAVAQVTEDRWVACAVQDSISFGLLPGGELQVATTLCREVRESRKAVVISDVAQSEAYCGHPTPALYSFQSYISVPIVLPDGSFFGTLCAIDPQPKNLANETESMFRLMAELIGFHLGSLDLLSVSEARLLDERRASALREEFIAVLGHDLRNPLASIDAGMRLLTKTPLNEQATRIVGLVHSSVARMAALIENVLDFARGRLGGGLTLERNADQPLGPVLTQIVAEMQASWPDRCFDCDLQLSEPIHCDRNRIAQLLSNLLGNAVTYGEATKPIRIKAVTSNKVFELAVANAGPPIPLAARERLFQPFTRGDVRPSQQGLGLGLYICSAIAQAHGGSLDVVSSDQETRFTCRMPLI